MDQPVAGEGLILFRLTPADQVSGAAKPEHGETVQHSVQRTPRIYVRFCIFGADAFAPNGSRKLLKGEGGHRCILLFDELRGIFSQDPTYGSQDRSIG